MVNKTEALFDRRLTAIKNRTLTDALRLEAFFERVIPKEETDGKERPRHIHNNAHHNRR